MGQTQDAPKLGKTCHPLFSFQNQIEKIENLGCFPNLRYGQLLPLRGERGSLLRRGPRGAVGSPPHAPVLCRFLSLAGNRIRRVENLQPLRHLRVLDLSHNQIQTLDPGGMQRRGYRQEREGQRGFGGGGVRSHLGGFFCFL